MNYNPPTPNPGNIPYNGSEYSSGIYTSLPAEGGVLTGNLTLPSIHVTNSTVSTNYTTGCCILSGGLGVSGAIHTASNLTITGSLSGITTLNSSGINTLTDSTQSTSISTGACILSGGLGVGKDIFTNGKLVLAGSLSGVTTINSTGITTLSDSTQSTAYTNGSCILSGGLGVAKDIFTNGKLTIVGALSGCTTISSSGINTLNATTASTAYTNGALVCSGGAGIAGDLFLNGIINMAANANDRKLGLFVQGSTDYYGFGANTANLYSYSAFDHTWYTGSTPSSKGTQIAILTRTGAFTITGTLSKASGTFDIVHPILKEKRLRHSFVESPTVDNIYRGKIQLVDGIANIDLNQKYNLTDGTLSALNNNFDFYLQNNTSFDRVIATLENDILTITCENQKSNDIISFLVIGERQDEFIKNWDATDDNGHLICEYIKKNAD